MQGSRLLRRAGLAAPALVALALAAVPASAHPARIGRYTEIPYGIRADHPFPTARGDARRTGRLRGVAPREEPVQLWERSLRHRRPRGPAVAADGTLYLGTMGGLTAMSADGVERWSAPLGAVYGTPSLMPSGDVVAVTRAGGVAVVTPDGVVRSTVDLGAPSHGLALVLDDGSILVGTIDRRVHRLDASLRRVFTVELPESTGMTLSRTAGGLFALPSVQSLRLLDARGGVVRDVGLGGRPTVPVAVADDGTLWIVTVEGAVLAIEPSGRVRSRTELGSRHYDGAALAVGRDGAVRVPTLTEGIVCIGPGGSERWRVPNQAGYHGPATIDDEDTTLVVDRGGRMIAIAADGTERWRVVLGTYSFEAPVLGPDGTLYVTTERGGVQAWGAPP